ncbi:hypothetical protein N7326_08245 [Corynebacterium sp. ES2794-CONJ1]|uniref:hypothetical protein n=1 Tax=unclassified Corynebacterium TaxID=2624378 RepID=UPI002166E3A7|nr:MULTISPECIES: hypothetical protein [unclassified Corynebacterium]MCS4490573.1 hypothetical protein [Corynebacterium sp. ES2775-CONJ]MCS4492352.1 hypothetical protein [Corynebacterium sp. ES2715-CONJ3]MCS4532456.1 hypothetical protein [Corynebacterium sp. ES2730-CONJ]MCU9519851.1 hypothetical protein [Corynebacterium sp. ES2794-CONJ1]
MLHVFDATVRHLQLTQEIFNIGDEVATYIENLAEAIADWDAELVEDCLEEFSLIVEDARDDSRRVMAELIGLRQALTSGLASGTVSMAAPRLKETDRPVIVNSASLRERFPLRQSPVSVQELSIALRARTEFIGEYLDHIVQWELKETERAARDVDSLSLPLLYARTFEAVTAASDAWLQTVATEHPRFTAGLRGSHPPAFLSERARIDAVVARVKAKKHNKVS